MLLLSGLSLAAWVALALGRGRFWKAGRDEHHSGDPLPDPSARVEIVVPARNEARTIGSAVASLVAQRYHGLFAVTLVDDDSTDQTAAVACAAVAEMPERQHLTVVPGRSLRAPWTGKLNALDAGVAFVIDRRGAPDYWLFTDADIEHDPHNLANLVDKARRDSLALVSLMVRLRCESRWEKLLAPAFIFFFQKLYPFAWSNDPRRSTAAAAGGCILIRADALARIGGLQSISDRLIDDCALAAAVKKAGGATWLGLTSRTASIREYDGLSSFWSMVKRTAFTQLRHSYVLTASTIAGMLLLYLLPPSLCLVAMARRDARVACIAGGAWTLMALLYTPTLQAYRRPLYEAFALPLAALLYAAMTIDSALAQARGRGAAWKGRVHNVTEPQIAPPLRRFLS